MTEDGDTADRSRAFLERREQLRRDTQPLAPEDLPRAPASTPESDRIIADFERSLTKTYLWIALGSATVILLTAGAAMLLLG